MKERAEIERKDILEAIQNLLRSTQEIKTYLTPIVGEQTEIFRILEAHEKAISQLMEKLVGTVSDHKKRFQKLELDRSLVETRLTKIEKRLDDFEEVYSLIKTELRGKEFSKTRKIIKRIEKEDYSPNDLAFISNQIQKHSYNVYLWYLKAELLDGLLDKGFLEFKEESISFMRKATIRFPEDSYLRYWSGIILDDFEEKLESFNKSIEYLKPDEPLKAHLTYFSKSSLLANNKKFEDALACSIKAVEANPKCPGGWLQKGRILLTLERYTDALGCFEKAIELEKRWADAWFYRGIALSSLGADATNEAIKSLNKAIKLDKKNWGAYVVKGDLQIEKGKFANALQSYQAALNIKTDDPCIWCKKGAALDLQGKEKPAIEAFEQALKIEPSLECAIIINNLAFLLYKIGNYQDSLKLSRKAAELEPENPIVLDTLACSLQAIGEDEDALDIFEKALRLRENDSQISWDALAKVYQKRGMNEKAKEALDKAALFVRAKRREPMSITLDHD